MTHDDVFGRKLTGDITASYESRVEQEAPEKFMAFLDELLETDGVKAVRWEQYTPYFADGDPCIFSSNEYSAEVQLEWLTDDDEYEGWVGEDSGSDLRGEFDRVGWEAAGRDYSVYDKFYSGKVAGHDTAPIVEALDKFKTRLGGPHDDWLQKTFGDHAQVTATPEGFNVEYYEHD